MGEEAIIQAQGLRLGYGPLTVLERVDLGVRQGEFWFLLGPNGAGKSTLVSALLGMMPLRAGHIRRHPELAGRQRLGFVPQGCALNPSLPTTVREFVLLGLVGLRTTAGERAERLNWALAKLGLAGIARASYWTLSGGQRQRALVARALIRRPTLLIMDEPANGLDLAAETALLEYLARMNREENLTILCVSHNLASAFRYASHVALFHGGGVQGGPAAEILTSDNLQRVYGIGLDVSWEVNRAVKA